MKQRLIILTVLALSIFGIGCKVDEPAEVWNPITPESKNPMITTVLPAGGGYSGITEIRIIGKNFSTIDSANAVFFNEVKAQVKRATTETLFVIAPSLISTSITIKVTVPYAIQLAKFTPYRLEEASTEYGNFLSIDEVYSIAVDKNENVYAQLKGDPNGIIWKVTTNGTKTQFGTIAFPKAYETRIGPGGYLYCQQTNNFALHRIVPTGGTSTLFATLPIRGQSFDFDSVGNMFVGGRFQAGVGVVKLSDSTVRTAGSFAQYNIRSVRVFKGYLYFLNALPSTLAKGVYRAKITSAIGDLGPIETIFSMGSDTLYAASDVQSLAISEGGDLYIGTDNANPILIVKSNGSTEKLYSGVLKPPAGHIIWGNGTALYVNRNSADAQIRRVMKIDVGKKGAVDFGRQ